jgi:hypothetical protein
VRQLVLPLVTLGLLASPAWALKPSKHRDLAEAACAAQHLPTAFCDRIGQTVFEVDYREWTDLAAHAQREPGQDRCAAADAAADRVTALATDAITSAHARDYDAAAVALGRALHTLQDECAHHGMTNEEHAFLSLEDTCGDDVNASPDTQPAAIECARTRTNDAMAAAALALADVSWAGVDTLCRGYDNENTCQLASLPSPFQACDFLALHKNWDGADSRWNADLVGPALVAAFNAGLRGSSAPSVCATSSIDPVAPHPLVTNRDAGCGLTDIVCLGKADAPEVAPETTGGCNAVGAPGLLVALLALRRKKRV